MRLWKIWDTLFPTCSRASQAVARARRTYPLSHQPNLGTATVIRYAQGWWVRFSNNPSPRFVHRGSGVVYYPTASIPTREVTENYFRNFHSSRRIWCLSFPHSPDESEAIESTLQVICSGNRHFIPRHEPLKLFDWSPDQMGLPLRYLSGPWIRGSGAAMEWLAKELYARGLSSKRKLLPRRVARQTRLFRLSHFQMSLSDALEDNGRTWHGLAAECLFEEADDQ